MEGQNHLFYVEGCISAILHNYLNFVFLPFPPYFHVQNSVLKISEDSV